MHHWTGMIIGPQRVGVWKKKGGGGLVWCLGLGFGWFGLCFVGFGVGFGFGWFGLVILLCMFLHLMIAVNVVVDDTVDIVVVVILASR